MKKNEKTHSALLALVGGYLLFTAWQLFQDWQKGVQDSMPETVRLVVSVLFALAGLAVLGYSWAVWRRSLKQDDSSDNQDDSVKN